MPSYDFECSKCNHTFDRFMSFNEYEIPTTCPECGETSCVHRVYSAPDLSVPKTVGSLADKNRDSMSEDHRQHLKEKHNAYRK